MKASEIITLVGIAFLLFLHFCDRPNSSTIPVSSRDTIFIKSKDPVHILPTKEYVPYRVEVPGTPGQTLTIPTNIDSGAVVKDYFSKRLYNDSTGNDSVKIYLSANVYKNELRDLKLKYRITAPTMLVKETRIINKQLLFIGVDVCSNGKNLTVYPGFYFDLKKGMLGAGYDPVNKSFKAGFYGKLKLWNRN